MSALVAIAIGIALWRASGPRDDGKVHITLLDGSVLVGYVQ